MTVLDEFAKVPLSRKIAGLVVLCGLVGTAYYFARYQSLASTQKTLVRRNSELQREEREHMTKRESYEADVRRLAQMREQFATQSRILPSDTEMSAFLESLNNQAELAGLQILLVQPLDEEAAGFYAKIPVELHLQGKYHELSKFFYNIGRLERVINIENISLNLATKNQGGARGENPESEVRLEAHVLATTFRALESQSAPVAAAGPTKTVRREGARR